MLGLFSFWLLLGEFVDFTCLVRDLLICWLRLFCYLLVFVLVWVVVRW